MYRFLAHLFLVTLAAIALALLTAAGPDRRSSSWPDLAILDLRTEMSADRRVTVEARVTNRGDRRSAPAVIRFQSNAWIPRERLVPALAPREERVLSFTSPPMGSGDHWINVRIEAARLDLDEANNVTTTVVRVPSSGAATSSKKPVAVPDLEGRTQRQASRMLRHAGLSPVVYEHAIGRSTERVREQWPDPGTRIAPRSGVLLVLASNVTVPEVRGMSLEDARANLRNVGVEMAVSGTRPSFKDWTAKVVGQQPAAGDTAELRSPVAVELIDPTPAWTLAGALFVGLGTVGFLAGRRGRTSHRAKTSAPERNSVLDDPALGDGWDEAAESDGAVATLIEEREDDLEPPPLLEPAASVATFETSPWTFDTPEPSDTRYEEPSDTPYVAHETEALAPEGAAPEPAPVPEPNPEREHEMNHALEMNQATQENENQEPAVNGKPEIEIDPVLVRGPAFVEIPELTREPVAEPELAVPPRLVVPPDLEREERTAVVDPELQAALDVMTATVAAPPPPQWSQRWDAGAQQVRWLARCRWECHRDPGTVTTRWNLESCQPPILLRLVRDRGRFTVEGTSDLAVRSEIR